MAADARYHREQFHHESHSRTGGLDTKKKTLRASEQDQDRRAAWWRELVTRDPARFVVIDESGSTIAMTPRYARAPKGQRASGAVPRNHGKNITLFAALSLSGVGAAMTLDGAADTIAFEGYVRTFLVPTLHPGQIVLLDNLSSHKSATVKRLITDCGCTLLFLPPYSPDFSPIELAFSKIKSALRRAGARTREALEEAICSAIDTVTPTDAAGYFRHCGYILSDQPL